MGYPKLLHFNTEVFYRLGKVSSKSADELSRMKIFLLYILAILLYNKAH